MRLLRPSKLNTHGTSLIEVLVALVVFLVGILSVVRLFPGGFATMMQTENSTLANSLAQAELDRWKSRSANLPAGILGFDPLNPGTVLADMDPEDFDPIPLGDPVYDSDINKTRHVYAEVTPIPAPSGDDWVQDPNSSIYVLGFSPIFYDPANPDCIKVYSNPLRRVDVPEDLTRSVIRFSDYAIDINDAVLYVRAAPFDRQFVITYSYWNTDSLTNGQPQLETVLSQPVNVAAGQNVDGNFQVFPIPGPGGTNISNATGFKGIEQGSDTLHRRFVNLTGTGFAWSSADPYQFIVKDAAAGVIAFNPNGYGATELTNRGRQPLKAYIDYDVRDWHVIREERTVPDTTTSPTDPYVRVKLTLSYIKEKDSSPEYDGTTYAGMPFDPDPMSNWPYDVLAVDMRTGMKFTEKSLFPDPYNGNTQTPVMEIDYKNGVARVHKYFAGRTFLFCYRAEDDWGVQVFKTYDIYRRHHGAITLPEQLGYQEYFVEVADTPDRGKMFFHQCYAGGSVAVDYTYKLNDPSSPEYTVIGDTYAISTQTGRYGLCSIDVLGRLAKSLGLAPDQIALTSVSRVYGVSLGARVIWRDSGSGLITGRWKKVSLQTYLTRTTN